MSKSSSTNKLFAGAVGAGVIVMIAAAFGSRFFTQPSVLLGALLLAATLSLPILGMAKMSPEPTPSAGWISSLGLNFTFISAAGAGAILALVLAAFSWYKGAFIVELLTLLCLAALAVIPKNVSNFVDEVQTIRGGQSQHLIWHQELRLIAIEISDAQIRSVIEDLAQQARFSSRDSFPEPPFENEQIAELIAELPSVLGSQDSLRIEQTTTKLKSAMTRRESTIASSKRQA